MLQKLHEKIKGWVASVIIGLLCVVFVLWGLEYYVNGSQAKGEVVVEVDGEKITSNDVNTLVRRMQRQLIAERGVALTDPMNQQLKTIAMQNLVDELALSQAAHQLGFTVQKDQMQQVISEIPEFQENEQFSPQRFQNFLSSNGLDQQQFLAQLRTDLLINQVSSGIESSTFLLPSEFEYYFNLLYQVRTFQYLTISAQQFMNTVTITPSEEKSYYANNRESLRTPAQVSINYIELSPEKISQGLKISDAELKQYYQDHLANYREPATWKVERITVPLKADADSQQIAAARKRVDQLLEKLKQKDSFATLYKEENGLTELLSENTVTPDVAKVLQDLKPGQVSQPYHTPAGFNIVRLVAVTPAKTRSFADAESGIKSLLMQQKAQQVIANMSDQLNSLTYTNYDSLEPAAKALNLSVQSSPFFTAEGDKTGIASNPEIVAVAFSSNVLQKKENSNPITLKNGSVIVLRVNKYLPSKIPEQNAVQDKIHAILIQHKAEAKAALLAAEIQQLLQSNKSADALVQENHLHWTEEKNIQRDNKVIPDLILNAAFNLSLKKTFATKALGLPNGDSVVIRLLSVQKPDFLKVNNEQKQQLQKKIQKMFAEIRYRLYVIGVQANAKIKHVKN